MENIENLFSVFMTQTHFLEYWVMEIELRNLSKQTKLVWGPQNLKNEWWKLKNRWWKPINQTGSKPFSFLGVCLLVSQKKKKRNVWDSPSRCSLSSKRVYQAGTRPWPSTKTKVRYNVNLSTRFGNVVTPIMEIYKYASRIVSNGTVIYVPHLRPVITTTDSH